MACTNPWADFGACYEHPEDQRNVKKMREQLDRLHLPAEAFEEQDLQAED